MTGFGVIVGMEPGIAPRPVRHIHAEHRQAEEGRLEDGLFMDAADVRRGREVDALGARQRFTDGDVGPGFAGAQLLREVAIQPLAVLEEVRVAVLVAGTGDEDRSLLGEGLGPVQGQGDARERLAVDEVVPGVAAGARTR